MTPLGRRATRFAPLILAAAIALSGQQIKMAKQKPDRDKARPQTLEAPPEPPSTAVGETAKLVFHTSPLSAKGLLTQQTKDALKALAQVERGAQPIKLRAFVAGTGDLRRVGQIVAETFVERKQPIPAVTTIQVGSLPMDGAQIQIESTAVDRRDANPSGLVLLASRRSADIASAVASLSDTFRAASSSPLRITCLISPRERLDDAQSRLAATFAQAAIFAATPTRLSSESSVECEAMGRAAEASQPSGGDVVVKATRITFSAAQQAFHDAPSDIRLAFERLGKSVSLGDAVYANVYATTAVGPLPRFAKEILPRAAIATWTVEGLPSADAPMAVEVIAPVPGTALPGTPLVR